MKKLENLLTKSNVQIPICKICFKEIHNYSFFNILCKTPLLCKECLKLLNPIFFEFKINDIKAMAIYPYDENMKSLIYQFKGCYDVELAPIFLYRYTFELKLIFYNYVLIPAPSFYLQNERRGFNHVEEIFKYLNLKIINCFEKIDDFKQSEQKKDSRQNIKDHLKINNKEQLVNKKLLIVDDIYTTGSTIQSMISLLKEIKIKDLKVLVLCKVNFDNIEQNKISKLKRSFFKK